MTTPFVDPALLGPVTSGDAASAVAAALAIAQGYTGQTLTAVTGDVALCDPQRSGAVFLHQLPVTNVSAVSVWTYGADNVTLGWQPVAPTNYRLIPARGEIRVYSTCDSPVPWSGEPGSVQVTYDHGYATVPEDLQSVILQIAAMLQSNPRGLVMRRVGEKVDNYGTVIGGVTLRDSWKAVLDRYTNPAVA